jgi:hypothetical protein
MLLGLCNVGVRIVEFALIAKQDCHGAMSQKQLVVPVERLRNYKGYIVVVDSPPSLSFYTKYVRSTVGFAEVEFLAFPQEIY